MKPTYNNASALEINTVLKPENKSRGCSPDINDPSAEL